MSKATPKPTPNATPKPQRKPRSVATPPSLASAVTIVERHGILLVFPIPDKADPPSLWSALYPEERMRWEWSDDADSRVVQLWRLRERLAESRRVVYSKWHGGRATLFSRDVFRALLRRLHGEGDPLAGAPRASLELLEVLDDNSPQSTKELKRTSGLIGKEREAEYTRALRELWQRLLIVGAGEVDDGAFPSLAIGSTRLLFEDLWSRRNEPNDAGDEALARVLATSKGIARHVSKIEASLAKARGAR